MRAKSLALLALALGCGLVASIGITQVMAKRAADPGPMLETESIIVAIKDIPVNEPLTPLLVRLEDWPKDKVPPGAVGKMEEVEGRRCRTRLFAGEPILKGKLIGKGASEPGASPQIPKGYRVVSVKVDAVSGTASLIMPGDRVDVLVHLLPNAPAGINEPTTRTVLQAIKVFAVDAALNLDNLDGDGKSIPAKTISLLVTPEQAQKVTLATELGQVRLVLRSPDDMQSDEVAGVSSRELFGKSSAASREKEMADEGSHDTSSGRPEVVGGFLQFLQRKIAEGKAAAAAKSSATASAGPVPPSVVGTGPGSRYVMQLLLGTKRQEVVLEQDSSRGPGPDGTGFWRQTSSEGDLDAPATVPAPAAAPAGKSGDSSGGEASGPALPPSSETESNPFSEGKKS